ncbi:hypothetical protein B0H14DRAFT_3893537 [Mycena olivaceomarginata]|nr:hypothetical protein B0H14DRAFT_3893537 [Mycena olivaceomarginata]
MDYMPFGDSHSPRTSIVQVAVCLLVSTGTSFFTAPVVLKAASFHTPITLVLEVTLVLQIFDSGRAPQLRATGGRATAAATTTVAAAGSDAVLASIDAAASAASTAAAAAQQSLVNSAATGSSFTPTDPAVIGEEAFLQTKVRLETEAGLDTSAAQSALDAFLQSEGFGSEIPGATSTGIPGAAATFAPATTAAPATATITGTDAVLASIDAAASAASTAAAAAQQSLVDSAPPATDSSFTPTDPTVIGEEAFLQTKVRLETEAGLDTSAAQSALNAFLQSEGFGSEIPGATSTGIPGAAATFAPATTAAPATATITGTAAGSGAVLASIDAAASAASTAAAAAQQSLVDSAPPNPFRTLTDPAVIGKEAFLQTKVRLETEAGLDTSAARSALDAFDKGAGFGTTGLVGVATAAP